MDDPIAAPVNADPLPASSPVPNCPQAPAGYWLNPQNCTQWMPQEQAATIGNMCWPGQLLMPGRLRVAGNGANTVCACGPFFGSVATDALLFYGGAAAAALFFLPSPYKWYVAVPLAGLAVLGVTLGSTVL